jgi:polar amino acid transport system substrate-binding protein
VAELARACLSVCLGAAAAGLLLLGGAAPVRAQAGQTLRWGGDKGGGAPYIYEDRDGKLIGFEADLADYLAARLGRRPEFVQKEWNSLPQDLARKDIDCILNGYEWTPQREQDMASTIPYYAYRLQLLARQDDDSIRSWDDLRRRPGGRKKRVGVLEASAAERYLAKEYGNDVEVVALGEEGSTGVLRSVATGQLDATLQDVPVALYYVGRGKDFPGLRPVGDPVAPGYYVIFVRKADAALRDRLDEAIKEGLRDGTLRRIYEANGLPWDADQEHLLAVADAWPPDVQASDVSPLSFFPTLLRAAGTTVVLAVLSMPLAILIGLLVAVGRLYGPRWLDWPLAAYVELLRGTPILLQLFAIYYLLPSAGIRMDPFWAGVLGLAINYSAYEAENYRAGLLAVPRGQMEAALALGMTRWAALRHVIVPQAVRIVIPPVTNDFISLFKDTSICAVIAVTELTGRYRHLVVDHPNMVVQLALMTALLYLMMSYPLSLLARRLEVRSARPAA